MGDIRERLAETLHAVDKKGAASDGVTFRDWSALPEPAREDYYEYADALLPLINEAEAEVERLHSWGGLLELLDEHWPADIFPMPEGLDDAKSRTRRDTGPIILGLIRWVDKLSAEAMRYRKRAERDRVEEALNERVDLTCREFDERQEQRGATS